MDGMNSILFAAVVLGALAMTWYQAHAYRKIATKVLDSNVGLATQAAKAQAQNTRALQSIHTLVNSNLSAAQKRELDATRRDLSSLQEIVSLKESQGLSVSKESRLIIEEVKMRVQEMTRAATHTEKQTQIANEER
jgi:hypothetical protein